MNKTNENNSAILFVFSGTGNSLHVALKIQSQYPNCRIISLSKALRDENFEWSAEKIGFIFPVYFQDTPHIVAQFLENISIQGNPYLFAIATYGSEGGHPFQTMNKILQKQKKELDAEFTLKMPQNSIVLVNKMLSPEATIQTIERSEEMITKIGESISQKQMVHINFTKPTLGNRLMSWGGKFFQFRLINDRTYRVNKEKCIGCGTCQRVCPVKNIELIDGSPKWNHSCECCSACIHWCPKQAIENLRTEGAQRYHHPEIKLKQICNY